MNSGNSLLLSIMFFYYFDPIFIVTLINSSIENAPRCRAVS